MKTKTSFGSAGAAIPGTIILKEVRGFSFYWIASDKGTWTTLARHTWEAAGRTIRPGYTIAHQNGNTLDCSLDNLVEVSPSHATRLHKGLKIHAHVGRPRNEAKWAEKERRAQEREQVRLQKAAKGERPVGRPRKYQSEEERLAVRKQRDLLRRPPKYSPAQRELRRQQRVREAQRKREVCAVSKQWEKQASDNRKREEGKRLKTKAVDMTQLIPVKIDHKTTVYARPGQDIEEIKARYQKTKAA